MSLGAAPSPFKGIVNSGTYLYPERSTLISEIETTKTETYIEWFIVLTPPFTVLQAAQRSAVYGIVYYKVPLKSLEKNRAY